MQLRYFSIYFEMDAAEQRAVNQLTGSQRDGLLHALLVRLGDKKFSDIPQEDRMLLRSIGFMETTVQGKRYVRGQTMPRSEAELHIQLLLNEGHNVRHHNHTWTPAQKNLCPCWRAISKYIDNGYKAGVPGKNKSLSHDELFWLRNHTVANPKRILADLRTDLFAKTNVLLHVSSISRTLRETGLSRQVVKHMASQRFTPENIEYSRVFAAWVRRFHRPAFFDEAGINKNGMSHRRNDGWNFVGAGGAFLVTPLKDWPHENLTVMGMHDRTGAFGIDIHIGGTNTNYVTEYMTRMADILASRGSDVVILDNCLAHKPWHIELALNRRGIAVVFLPRYWVSFELASSDMIIFFLHLLLINPLSLLLCGHTYWCTCTLILS